MRIPGTVIDDYTTINSLTDHLVDSGVLTGSGPGAGPLTGLAAVLAAPAREVEPVAMARAAAVRVNPDDRRDRRARWPAAVRPAGQNVGAGELPGARESTRPPRMDRIGRLLSVYDQEGRLAAEMRRRVSPVLGDVTLDGLGLDEADPCPARGRRRRHDPRRRPHDPRIVLRLARADQRRGYATHDRFCPAHQAPVPGLRLQLQRARRLAAAGQPAVHRA